MKPVVFIHTNDQQLLAAQVSAYSLRARSRHPDDFDVRLLRLEETPQLYRREGQRFVWDGGVYTWTNRDLQSFGPLRRMVPQVMGFRGHALVLDPDVFAVGDVYELITRHFDGKAILCRTHEGWARGLRQRRYSSAVMLLDCARLTHWQWDREIDAAFARQLDLYDWISLMTEPPETIGAIEEEWNHLDTLNERTKLLHNTRRCTQPWKTGLRVDFDLFRNGGGSTQASGPWKALRRIKRRLRGSAPHPPRFYQPHPDPRQERFFFSLLKECVEHGVIAEEFIRSEIVRQHLRADAFALLAAVQ